MSPCADPFLQLLQGKNQRSYPMPQEQPVTYRCRKCRRLLATDRNVVRVPEAKPERGAKYGQTGHQSAKIFVEPMAWMEGINDGDVQGKLYCAGCAPPWRCQNATCCPKFPCIMHILDVVSVRLMGDADSCRQVLGCRLQN